MTDGPDVPLLGAAEIRALAARHGIRPTKQWGQNFVVDGNTVRRIVRVAGVGADDIVVEVGPGLGSLTLALLPAVDRVVAVEVDPVLAQALPGTVAQHAPALADRLEVVLADAMTVRDLPGPPPTALVANLPYNVSVPVRAARSSSCSRACAPILVMVQLEVAERLAAPARVAHLRRAERQGRLVRRRAPGRVGVAQRLLAGAQRRLRAGRADPARAPGHHRHPRGGVRVRRRGLRPAAQDPAGGAGHAGPARRRWRSRPCVAAGVDPRTRGEQLDVAAFAAIAAARAGRPRAGAARRDPAL